MKFENNQSNKKYDLEERTAIFAEKIIDLCKKAPKNEVTRLIVNQLGEPVQVLVRTTAKQMVPPAKKIFATRYLSAKKSQKKQGIG